MSFISDKWEQFLKWLRDQGVLPGAPPENPPDPDPPGPEPPGPSPDPGPIPFVPGDFPASWCFQPATFRRWLSFPISHNGGSEHGGFCYVKVLTPEGWKDSLVMGPDPGTEDICKLPVFNDRQYVIAETNDGIYASAFGVPWPYERVKKFRGKSAGEYGAFDGCVHGQSLKVPISGYYPGEALVLWDCDESNNWTPIKSWQAQGERPTGWACGSDGVNFYLSIAGFARGTRGTTRFDGIWVASPSGWAHEHDSARAQVFCDTPLGMMAGLTGGEVLVRKGYRNWPVIFRVPARFVVSIAMIGDTYYFGGEDPPTVCWTRDFKFFTKRQWTGSGPAYICEYNGVPVVARWEGGLAVIEQI